MQPSMTGVTEVECDGLKRSVASGKTLVPSAAGVDDSEVDDGRGNSKVKPDPESVAKPRKGIVNISIPNEIWRRISCGDDGSSRER